MRAEENLLKKYNLRKILGKPITKNRTIPYQILPSSKKTEFTFKGFIMQAI
tara:strand:+ start:12315 stop:12467 length:153 start_codon:yes stop_codon:yes gene_type:complete